jgi:hypothetical protein
MNLEAPFPFSILPILVFLIFGIVFASILIGVLRGLAEWASNSGRPLLSEAARVVTKRTEVRGTGLRNQPGRTWTIYYCTFQFADGGRREFRVPDEEFGLLVEGDEGILTSQGTRYRGFRRHNVGAKPAPGPRDDF